MAEEPRAWKARTRGSEAEVDGVIRPSTVTARVDRRAAVAKSGRLGRWYRVLFGPSSAWFNWFEITTVHV
jgi:hypothetical protein